MNPDSTIRPWLLACGKQYGIRVAEEYFWDAPETRQEEAYCTYQSLNELPAQVGVNELSTADANNTVTHKQSQSHHIRWRIDLYNSKDGMYELSSFIVALRKNKLIKAMFKEHGGGFNSATGVENETTWSGTKKNYHMSCVVTFNEHVEISLVEINGEVEQIDLTIETGDPTYEIDRTGITVT